jgi:DNA (cytosine-5)-methyltransferase 1
MKYGSVCSGVEAATVAWHPLGWEPKWFSEIDKFPSAVLAHHYPDVPNYGDMTTFKEWPDDPIDLLVGGTPCQSFSVAGLRKGLDDPRGNLMLTYLAIAERYQPRWLVWENVPGVLSSNRGRDFGTFLGALGQIGYGFAYRVLDAQYFGVAQRRRRVFVVGYLGDWRRAAAVLFERESLSGHPAPIREARQDVAQCLTRGVGQRYDPETETLPMTAGSLCARTGRSISSQDAAQGHLLPIAFGAQNSAKQGDSVSQHITPTLDKSKTPAVMNDLAVRRLTPRECERLQGFPDDYTLIQYRGKDAADGPRYKAMGNSMAVPVMRWIGERIQMVESIQ